MPSRALSWWSNDNALVCIVDDDAPSQEYKVCSKSGGSVISWLQTMTYTIVLIALAASLVGSVPQANALNDGVARLPGM